MWSERCRKKRRPTPTQWLEARKLGLHVGLSGSLRRYAKPAQEFRFVEYFDTQLAFALSSLLPRLFTCRRLVFLVTADVTLPPAFSISSRGLARGSGVGGVPVEDDVQSVERPIAGRGARLR